MLKELRKLIAEKLLDFSRIIMPDGEEKIILCEAISFYIKNVVIKNFTQQQFMRN